MFELVDAGGEPGRAFAGSEQVRLQGGPGHGRADSVAGGWRGGFSCVDLAEQVAVPVKKGPVDGCGAGDGRDADLGAVGGGLAERGDDALAAAGRVGLAALCHRLGPQAQRPGLGARRFGASHAMASRAGDGGATRTAGMPRLTARCLRMTATASSTWARSASGSCAMSPLIRLMSLRIRVISSWAGVASARAQSSTPSMAAARRSRVRSRSSR